MYKSLLVLVLGACSWKGAPEAPDPGDVDYAAQVATASSFGDVTSIEKLLHGSVANGGLWFNDPECMKQFPVAERIEKDRIHAFAACLAGLKLQRSNRKDMLLDVAVLTYAPGIEVEARIYDDDQGPRLSWIGYESRRDVADGLPSISPGALEALRISGEPHGPLDPAIAATLELDREPERTLALAWVKVCIDGTGAVTGAHAREATSLRAARVFAAAASTWQFRPFVVNGQALPVCAMVRMVYPPASAPPVESLPVILDSETPLISPRAMIGLRVSGEYRIQPDMETKRQIQRAGARRISGTFKVCLDASGHVASMQTVRSTGFVGYDQKIQREISHLVYKPYVDEGRPVPVCTGLTYIYAQR